MFGLVYLPAAYLSAPRSLRSFAKDQATVLAAASVLIASGLAYTVASGFGPLRGVAESARAFHYPLADLGVWFGIDLLVLAIAAGWVVVPGAVLGFRELIRSVDRRRRAFAILSLLLIAGLVFEAAVFGINEEKILERYAFYAVPLLAIAFCSFAESPDPKRLLYAAVAYAGAGAALLLPLTSQMHNAAPEQSTTMVALEFAIGDHSDVLIWAPLLMLLAVAVALRGPTRRRGLALVGVAICVLSSIGSSRFFVDFAEQRDVPPGFGWRRGQRC